MSSMDFGLNLNSLTLNGRIINAFLTPEKTDKKTGEVYEAKFRVQMLCQNEMPEGEKRLDLVTLGVDDATLYRKLEGQMVRVPVGVFVNGKALQFYALKGAKPEVVAASAPVPKAA